MRGLVEDLSQVAAGLLLNKNRGDQELQIGNGHTATEIDHGLTKWQSETLFIGGPAKLRTQWFVRFLSDSLYCGRECLACPQPARHQIDRFG